MIAGLGHDLVELDRWRSARARHGERLVERLFTSGEIEYAFAQLDPDPHLAARFAAKEAALKALGSGLAGGIRWLEVEVVRSPKGAPRLVLHGIAAEIAGRLGISCWHLSLTHTATYASAVVVAETKA